MAIDLYDGNVASTRQDAMKYIRQVTNEQDVEKLKTFNSDVLGTFAGLFHGFKQNRKVLVFQYFLFSIVHRKIFIP